MQLAKFKQHWPVIALAALFIGIIVLTFFYSHWRSHRAPVVVKNGVVFCRMAFDDFHFPLPSGAKGVTVSIASVSRDTINGSIFVKESDVTSYDVILARHGFRFKPGSLTAMDAKQPGGVGLADRRRQN
jgi:hypothetical protein